MEATLGKEGDQRSGADTPREETYKLILKSIIINKKILKCIRLRPVCALQTVTRPTHLRVERMEYAPAYGIAWGGVIARRHSGELARAARHPPLGGVEILHCALEIGTPPGGVKKAQFSPIYFGRFHPEASGCSRPLFLQGGVRTPPVQGLF